VRIAAIVLLLALAAVFAVAWIHRPTQSPWQRTVAAIKACHVSQIEEFQDRAVALTFALSRDRYNQPVKQSIRIIREPQLGAAAKAAAGAKRCGISIFHG
jgi:hypothetical protein